MNKQVVKFVAMDDFFDYPKRSTSGAAAYDLYSSNIDPLTLPNGKVTLVPTGIKVELPPGYHMDIIPRSGLANKQMIVIPNSPGLIDEDYVGPVLVGLFNQSGSDYVLERGTRIAQCKIQETVEIEWVKVDKLKDTARGEGGFGSTGYK